MPKAGFDPPFATSYNLLIEKVDMLTNQATMAGFYLYLNHTNSLTNSGLTIFMFTNLHQYK